MRIKQRSSVSDRVNDFRNTTFVKPGFYGGRYSYAYLLLDSDLLEDIIGLIHKKGWWNLGFMICDSNKGPLKQEVKGKSVTDQRDITVKLMQRLSKSLVLLLIKV